MTDFCYAANLLLLIFLNCFPQNYELFVASFLFSNGALAIAVGAFRNQMVFHSIDNMSSLALHMFPQIVTWNLRWHTMPYEATIPKDQRIFLDIAGNDKFDFMSFIGIPIGYYLVWVTIYFLINFVISAEKIK